MTTCRSIWFLTVARPIRTATDQLRFSFETQPIRFPHGRPRLSDGRCFLVLTKLGPRWRGLSNCALDGGDWQLSRGSSLVLTKLWPRCRGLSDCALDGRGAATFGRLLVFGPRCRGLSDCALDGGARSIRTVPHLSHPIVCGDDGDGRRRGWSRITATTGCTESPTAFDLKWRDRCIDKLQSDKALATLLVRDVWGLVLDYALTASLAFRPAQGSSDADCVF